MKYKMRTVKLSDIEAGNRYREDLGDLEELAESIKEKGLIQPLSVNSSLRLLAGGRRFAACEMLGLSEVPVLVRDGEDEIDAREVELMENIHRKEMTWQEQAKLTSEIHRLYSEKDPNWSGRKTAQLIDQSPMTVSRALNLAAGIEVMPDLAKCKTADEASKVMKKAEEKIILDELSRRQEALIHKSTSDKSLSKTEMGIAAALRRASEDYRIGDAFTGMEMLLSRHKKFQFIECDPPFGRTRITPEDVERSTLSGGHEAKQYIDIEPKKYVEFLSRLAQITYKLADTDAWMIFWFDFVYYQNILEELSKAGWEPYSTPAIWLKSKLPYQPYPDMMLNGYFPFIIAKKGRPIMVKARHNNTFLWSPDDNPYHPHQRPLSLMEDLLTIFVPPTSKVLVPFLGSGVTLRACYTKGYEGVGFDLDDSWRSAFLQEVEKDTKAFLAKE
jgi:ParB family chromosome partitioning protein